MNLKLEPASLIAPGGAVFGVAGEAGALWLASPAGVFHFDGQTWRAVMRGVPFWRVNTVLAAGNSVWAAGLPGGVVRSSDGGRSWHRGWTGQVEAPIISLVASPNYRRDRVLLAGTDGDGILRSTNGGRHWELSNFGLRDFAVLALATAPVWDRYEFAFAITEGGLYQSPNGGRAWRRAEVATGEVQPSAIAVSPEFAADRTVLIGCEGGELLISTDAGRSYRLGADGFDPITALTFSPEGALLVGTTEGIDRLEINDVRSLDNTPRAQSPLPSTVLSLDRLENQLYAGLTDGLYHASDEGRSWQPVAGLSARRFVWGLTPTPDLWLTAGPEEGVWRSQDEGQSWQQLWTDTPVLAVAATTGHIWISTPAGVVTSRDGGDSWREELSGEGPITALVVVEERVWAGGQDSRLWQRSLAGAWQALSPPFAGGQLLGLFAQTEGLVAAVWQAETGKVTLWRSEDEGQTWENWFSETARPLTPQVVFADETGREALVGLGPDLYIEDDSGWQRRRLTGPDAPITALLSLGSQTLAALTDRLVVSADNDEWIPVETALNGHPIAALQRSVNQVVVLVSEGRIWQGRDDGLI